MIRRQILAAVALALTTSLATPILAQQPAGPPPDALTDPALKGPEVLAFIGVKPGDKVADIVAGRFTRAFAQAVGPNGKLYAVMPDEIAKEQPRALPALKAGASQSPNIEVVTGPIDAVALPSGLDAVFIRQNYHDLYDKFMGPANVPAFNKKVFAALKPGGVFVILDHTAPAGSGLGSTDTTHRIDPERVKADMKAAGFVFDGESKIFVNPADDHTKLVFDPSVRGKTDQFLYRFRKPR
jgi:predicted methyltransferase